MPTTAAALSPDQVELEALGEKIAVCASRIDAAEHAMLTLVREFDERLGWTLQGATSCAHWLTWRTGMSLSASRERVRTARALGRLPQTDAALKNGDLSYSKARAITRVATPQTERDFIDIAEQTTAAQMDRIARAHIQIHGPATEPELGIPSEERLAARRFCRRWTTEAGMTRIEIQLPPEEAQIVWEAITAATQDSVDTPAEASETSTEPNAAPDDSATPDASPPCTTNADATPATASYKKNPAFLENSRADAVLAIAEESLRRRTVTSGSSYELLLVSSPERLENGAAAVGGFLIDGTPVSSAAARMIACDCGVVHDADLGHQQGRRTRKVGKALRRSLRLRDGGCAFPGCTAHRYVDAHHVEHWANGGPTTLNNLVLLCRQHHRMAHEGVIRVEMHDGLPTFSLADDKPIPRIAPVVTDDRDLDDLDAFIEEHGCGLDSLGKEPRWNGDLLYLDEVMDWLPSQ